MNVTSVTPANTLHVLDYSAALCGRLELQRYAALISCFILQHTTVVLIFNLICRSADVFLYSSTPRSCSRF